FGCDDARRADEHRTHRERVRQGQPQGNGHPRGHGHHRDHGHPREHGRHWGDRHPLDHAICHVQPNPRVGAQDANNITGEIRLRRQRSNGTEILFDLHGFRSSGKPHAVHVHEFGDLSNGCESLGGHFNPHNMRHGSHAGDLGNFRPSPDGSLHETLTQVQLGHHSIIGRSIVIHENEDDLGHLDNPGSLVHGNAGQRLACCVIGVSSGRGWPNAGHSPLMGNANSELREQAGGPQRRRRE
ncbi:uncharacterized protein LOC144487825, partial [Mustelus asterias]